MQLRLTFWTSATVAAVSWMQSTAVFSSKLAEIGPDVFLCGTYFLFSIIGWSFLRQGHRWLHQGETNRNVCAIISLMSTSSFLLLYYLLTLRTADVS